jgi:hypothetical protein
MRGRGHGHAEVLLRLKELLAEGKVDGREALVVNEEGLDLAVVGSKVALQDEGGEDRRDGKKEGGDDRGAGAGYYYYYIIWNRAVLSEEGGRNLSSPVIYTKSFFFLQLSLSLFYRIDFWSLFHGDEIEEECFLWIKIISFASSVVRKWKNRS